MFTSPEAPSSATTSTDHLPTHSSVIASKTVPSTHPGVVHTTTYSTTPTVSTITLPTYRTWQSHENLTTSVPPVKQATSNNPCHTDLETYPGPAHHTQADLVEDLAHLDPLESEQTFSSHNLIQLTSIQVSLKPNCFSTFFSPSP